jgi:hypothetical protein
LKRKPVMERLVKAKPAMKAESMAAAMGAMETDLHGAVNKLVPVLLLGMFEKEMETWNGSYLVYGLQLLVGAGPNSACLPESKEVLKALKSNIPGTRRVPEPEEMIVDHADCLLGRGDWGSAIASVLQLDTYLRPSEVAELKSNQLMPPAKRAGASYAKTWAIVIVPQVCTWGCDDSVLVAGVHMQWLTNVLDAAVERKKKNEQLLAVLTLPEYGASFEKFCVARGNTTASIFATPHCLRLAGASNDRFHEHWSLKEIQKRGPWAVPASVNRYNKEALILKGRKAKLEAIAWGKRVRVSEDRA